MDESLPSPGAPRLAPDIAARLVECAADAILAFDTEMRYTCWNPAMEKLWGIPAGTVLGRRVLEAFPTQVGPDVLERYRAALEGRVTTSGEHAFVNPRTGAQGYYESLFSPVLDDYGQVVGGMATIRDVTERVRQVREAAARSEELMKLERTARQAAEIANRTKADFLAVMSHELRTPLNAISGYTELLLMGVRGALNDQQREDLARIQRSQHHLLSLINDVLNFAKLEAGRVEYHLGRVDMKEVLDSLEPLVMPQLQERGVHFHHQHDRLPAVRADMEKLRQVLLNLLSNAAKFTPRDGSVTIRCTTEEDMVRVDVVDTGVGIAPDKLEQIFEPFVQLQRGLTSQHEGTGLGLAISRDLARGMGGELTVRSAPGEGSTFSMLLPRSRAAKDGAQDEEERARR